MVPLPQASCGDLRRSQPLSGAATEFAPPPSLRRHTATATIATAGAAFAVTVLAADRAVSRRYAASSIARIAVSG
jgi:hypothetical protein